MTDPIQVGDELLHRVEAMRLESVHRLDGDQYAALRRQVACRAMEVAEAFNLRL